MRIFFPSTIYKNGLLNILFDVFPENRINTPDHWIVENRHFIFYFRMILIICFFKQLSQRFKNSLHFLRR